MEKFTFETKYGKKENCTFIATRYYKPNNLALIINDEYGEQYCVASVNIENQKLSDNLIAIKNWSENEGVDEFLLKIGIIDKIVDYVPSGFVKIPIYSLTEKGKELFKDK